jgi:hypothetical protein
VRYLGIWAALIAANLLYAAVLGGGARAAYGVAVERSWFQGVALLLAWISVRP